MKRKQSKIKFFFKLIIFILALFSLSYTLSNCGMTSSAASTYTVRIGNNISGQMQEQTCGSSIKIADGSLYQLGASDYNYFRIGYSLKTIITNYTLSEEGNGFYIYTVTEDGYFNLIYELINYNITFQFYDNNGATKVNSQILTYGQLPSVPEVPTMPYGSFLSWDSAVTAVTANKQYTAVYSYVNYTLNYISNGELVKTVLVNHYDKTVFTYIPKLEKGYSFKGWALSEGGRIISETEIKSDITLYAVLKYDGRSIWQKIGDFFSGVFGLIRLILIVILLCGITFFSINFLAIAKTAFGGRGKKQ